MASTAVVTGKREEIDEVFDWIWYKIKNTTKNIYCHPPLRLQAARHLSRSCGLRRKQADPASARRGGLLLDGYRTPTGQSPSRRRRCPGRLHRWLPRRSVAVDSGVLRLRGRMGQASRDARSHARAVRWRSDHLGSHTRNVTRGRWRGESLRRRVRSQRRAHQALGASPCGDAPRLSKAGRRVAGKSATGCTGGG